jgi:hypothetical protein
MHGSTSDPDSRPYVSLILEVGVQPKVSSEAKVPTKFKILERPSQSTKKNTKNLKKQTKGRQSISGVRIAGGGIRHHLKPHPRYNIFAYGCSPTVYRGIDAEQKSMYTLLLCSRDFLGEHPRQNPESLSAIRSFKPFWSGGMDCLDWVEHDMRLHGPVPLENERVDVGDDSHYDEDDVENSDNDNNVDDDTDNDDGTGNGADDHNDAGE